MLMQSMAEKFREAGLATDQEVARAEKTKHDILEAEAELRCLVNLNRKWSEDERKRFRAYQAQLKILKRQRILASG